MNPTRILQVSLAAGALCGLCRADTIFLSDGTEVNGTIVEENNKTVAVKRANGAVQSFRRSDVETIVYDKKKGEEKVESKTASATPSTTTTTTAATPPTKTGPVESKPVGPQPTPGKTEAAPPAASEKTDPKTEPKTPATAEGSKTEPGKATGTEEKPKVADQKDEGKKEDGKKEDPNSPLSGKPGEKTADKKEGDGWTPPSGLPGFPDKAKRMNAEKEERFMKALEAMTSTEPGTRAAAKDAVAALGADALPYVVAGIQHANVEARSTCMRLVASFNGRTAVKQVLEVFYSAMPETDAAPTWQVPFIRAIKETLPAISGQTFINVEPDKLLVQDGLKKYLAWYEENYDRLPAQLGEPKIEPTDPEYAKKLKEARKLKLEKKSWPRPPMPADLVTGAKTPPASQSERPADKNLKNSIPTVSREDATKRNK